MEAFIAARKDRSNPKAQPNTGCAFGLNVLLEFPVSLDS
jgi:hypothetical protein